MMRTTFFILLLTISSNLTAQTAEKETESKLRIEKICELYNHDLNDSLIAQAPRDMAYHKSIGQWEHYYETWMHLVNTYTFMGKVNTALHEVKQMHDDATQRHNNYGLALSNYAMGNAYNNMGYLPEAVKCYQLSIQFIRQTNTSETTYNDIYSYYCDALNENHQWKEMKEVTDDWRKLLESMTEYDKGKKTSSSKVWYSYYYLACAQMHLGLNQFDQAEKDIDMAEVTAPDSTDFIQMSILYYRAQLCLQRKDYRKALDYNTRRLEKSLGYEDKSSLVMIREQRAKILNGLGRFEEMAEMYKEVYELTDSMYRKDARIQINELNTLFRVNEFEMEKPFTWPPAATMSPSAVTKSAWSARALSRLGSSSASIFTKGRLSGSGSLTVTAQVAVLPPSVVVTVIVALPAPTAFTLPSATVATASLSLLQLTVLMSASAGETVAVSVTSSPTSISSEVWSRLTDVTGTA